MKDYNELARTNNLKKIREQKGMTQGALAMVCRQSGTEISRYERGICMPSYVVLLSIATFLDVSIEEIYPGFHEIYEKIERQVVATKEYWMNKAKK